MATPTGTEGTRTGSPEPRQVKAPTPVGSPLWEVQLRRGDCAQESPELSPGSPPRLCWVGRAWAGVGPPEAPEQCFGADRAWRALVRHQAGPLCLLTLRRSEVPHLGAQLQTRMAVFLPLAVA